MRAYIMPAGCRSIDDVHMVERPNPAPGRGQVLVRVRATSLNRRDQAIADGTYFGRRVAIDTIPLSDCAGEIAAVGDGVTSVARGDRVAATFFQTQRTDRRSRRRRRWLLHSTASSPSTLCCTKTALCRFQRRSRSKRARACPAPA
jgi:NADPH:quinone reductase-like Zn-dependent oxidoreductase